MAKIENGKKENSEEAKKPPAEEKPAKEEKSAEGEKSEKQEIERLKFSVEKLSEELNTAVAELKRSIIDIRSAVSEIENPFNLLRVITSEKDLEKIKGERLPPGVKSIVIGKPEEKPGTKPSEEKLEEEKGKEKTLTLQPALPPSSVSEAEVSKEEVGAEEQRPSVRRPLRGTAFLDWIWSLLEDGFTSDDIRQLSRSYEQLGFLPEGCSDQIYYLAVAAEKARAKGLTRSRLLLNMYKASVISGVSISPDELKRLITIAERKSARGKMTKRVE